MREQIIFKADLSPALNQERLSLGAQGGWQAECAAAPAWPAGALFTDTGSSQTVSGLQPRPGRAPCGQGRSCLGACTCSVSEPVALSPSLLPPGPQLAAVHSRPRCSCPLEGGSHSLFLRAEASPEPPEFIWGLLSLSPELIHVLYWDFFPKDHPPFHSISLRGREGGGIRMVLLFSCCLHHRWCKVLL